MYAFARPSEISSPLSTLEWCSIDMYASQRTVTKHDLAIYPWMSCNDHMINNWAFSWLNSLFDLITAGILVAGFFV